MVDKTKYAVIDLEANGVDEKDDDLLSISLYRPDTHQQIEIFLPLEKNHKVYTTHINGITDKQVKNQKPLTQKEVDQLIEDFDLRNRTLLTYSDLDKKFMKEYFNEHQLKGIEHFHFYDFKNRILFRQLY